VNERWKVVILAIRENSRPMTYYGGRFCSKCDIGPLDLPIARQWLTNFDAGATESDQDLVFSASLRV
jgi:hypothetical protein